MSKTIAFHSNQISITGTEVALYDYAHYNEALLNNRSVILYDASSPKNHSEAIRKFEDRFELRGYQHRDELDELLRACKVDLLYAIKAGKRDGLISRVVPTMVHAVFPCNPAHAHGSSYAYISEWLSQNCSNGKIPSVPHIVHLPEEHGNLRSELGIPENATVVGCHGGQKSFDAPCAIDALDASLKQAPHLYAVFLNIDQFLNHPRAIFLPGTTDVKRKVRFINTCDAMLHARLQGESFGLACGEFSIRNKPVITFRHGKHSHHISALGDRGLYYDDKESLINILKNLNLENPTHRDWDCYTARYNPATVMVFFERHLIHPALKTGVSNKHYEMGWRDRLAYPRYKFQARFFRSN